MEVEDINHLFKNLIGEKVINSSITQDRFKIELTGGFEISAQNISETVEDDADGIHWYFSNQENWLLCSIDENKFSFSQ